MTNYPDEIDSVETLLDFIEDLRSIENSEPALSLYCEAGKFPEDAKKAAIHFKNLLSEAETLIANNALDDLKKHLRNLTDLLDDDEFWNHQYGGLGVFLKGDFIKIIKLGAPLTCEVTLGKSFHLKPLLALAANADLFYLLSISQKETVLHRISRLAFHEDVCKTLPNGYEDAMTQLGYDEDSRAMMGLKSERKVEDQYLREYFKMINEEVATHLTESDIPLILAAVGYYGPIYREINTYQHLSDNLLSGNHEHSDLRELANQAQDLLHSELLESQKKSFSRYQAAKGNDLSVEGINGILEAAKTGNLKTVFLPGDTAIWGTISEDNTRIHLDQSSTLENSDLYEVACRNALDSGAEVYFLDTSQLPTKTKAVGTLRWQDAAAKKEKSNRKRALTVAKVA